MPTKFKIESVANALGLKFKSKGDSESLYYCCPFCNDNKGKLNINIKGNVWRCNKCGESGGVIHLVQAYLECSREDALNWLYSNPNVIIDDGTFVINESNNKLADEDVLDVVYREMLSLLTLNKSHRKDLYRRGLSDEAIEKYLFKSVPGKIQGQKIAAQLINKGYSLLGVPGFYTSYNTWRMSDTPGYLIPFINVRGKITGFQIRTDKPGERNAKYISFTSRGKTNGTKSSIEVNFVGYNGQSAIFLTEGALKSDIAAFLSEERKHKPFAFLAIPGVDNIKAFKKSLPELKAMGIKTMWNTFDMDRTGNCDCEFNEHVFKAIQRIKKIVLEAGFEWKTLEWDFEKGIDDYLLFLKMNQY